jgi:hypothetical protein
MPIQTAFSREKLLGHQHAQAVVLADEFADEFVQTSLKYSVHPVALKTRANTARMPLRRTLTAIGGGDRIEIANDCLVTGRK